LSTRCAWARLAAMAPILVFGWANPPAVWSQTGDPGVTTAAAAPGAATAAAAPMTAPLPAPGLQIRSISGYGVYYSSFTPLTSGIPQPGSNLSSDFGYGGSVVIGWTRVTERTNFSLTYTPSYTGLARYSSLDALNHSFSLSISRHLAPRWTLGFSLAGSLSTMEESLFAPTTLSTVASLPASFQDLASGLLQSQFANNPQLGSLLNSAQVIQSPLNTLLYGEHMFSGSLRSSLSHSFSPRLSMTFEIGGSRTQHLSGDESTTTPSNSLILNATSGSGSVSLSYSLSPRTQISGSLSTTWTSSSLYDMYTTTSLVSVGRTFARRWILQAHGGAGITNPVRQMVGFSVPVKPYPSAGGSLTYKTSSHTFLVSYDRTITSSYGLGANTSASVNATWRWRLPGRSWWIDSTIGWQGLQGGALANTSGWHSTTGFNQAVGTHTSFRMEYAYMSYSGGLQGSTYNFSQSAVRFSLSWYPPSNALRW
jgi:hypothetical protein